MLQKILNGYSEITLGEKKAFLRHFSPNDQLGLDKVLKESEEKWIQAGALTRAQKRQELIDMEIWSIESEREMEILDNEIKDIQKNIDISAQHPIHFDEEHWENEIIKKRVQLNDLRLSRSMLMGKTSEVLADEDLNMYILKNFIYTNKEMNNLFFEEIELDSLNDHFLYSYMNSVFYALDEVSYTKVSQLATTRSIQDLINPCSSIYEMYGKPVIYLTHAQLNLYTVGQMFKPVFKRNPPEEFYGDPERLMRWANNENSVEDIEQKQKQYQAKANSRRNKLEKSGKTSTSVLDRLT